MKILEVLTKKRLIGNAGETYAKKHLKRQKYRILEENYVALGNEIDIIAKTRDTFVFVEVKTRTEGHESPYEARPASSVTPEKQRKIIKAASYYRKGIKEEGRMRFDIIEVILKQDGRVCKICQIENAFDKNSAYHNYHGE